MNSRYLSWFKYIYTIIPLLTTGPNSFTNRFDRRFYDHPCIVDILSNLPVTEHKLLKWQLLEKVRELSQPLLQIIYWYRIVMFFCSWFSPLIKSLFNIIEVFNKCSLKFYFICFNFLRNFSSSNRSSYFPIFLIQFSRMVCGQISEYFELCFSILYHPSLHFIKPTHL